MKSVVCQQSIICPHPPLAQSHLPRIGLSHRRRNHRPSMTLAVWSFRDVKHFHVDQVIDLELLSFADQFIQ